MTFLGDLRYGSSHNPLWWRIPAWALLTAFSVLQADGLGRRLATGVIMGASAAVLQFVQDPRRKVRLVAVLVPTVGGLAACLLAPHGVAEALVVVAASRAPYSVEGIALRWFTTSTSVAFAVVVAVITNSLSGLLAGIAIPAFVQRAIEHRDLIRERDRAQALLAEVQGARESETQTAALQERARIARELHDVLAHSLAGLSVQLQAVRALAARAQVTPAVTEPLDKAAALARDGLAEAREAVSALRDPVGLGLDALPALVERHPGQATRHVHGAAGAVSPQAGHAIYRVVQESLTNAVRYAPGSAVDVDLRWAPGELTVTVVDSGPGPGREPVAEQGTGLGLAGMAERMQQVGGHLQAGPAGRGWEVTATVPAMRTHTAITSLGEVTSPPVTQSRTR